MDCISPKLLKEVWAIEIATCQNLKCNHLLWRKAAHFKQRPICYDKPHLNLILHLISSAIPLFLDYSTAKKYIVFANRETDSTNGESDNGWNWRKCDLYPYSTMIQK